MVTIESFQNLVQTANLTDDTAVSFKDADKTVLGGRTVADAGPDAADDAVYLRSQLLKAVSDLGSLNLDAIERELFGEKTDGKFSAETAAKPLTLRTVKSVLAQAGKLPAQPAAEPMKGVDDFVAIDDFEEIDLPAQTEAKPAADGKAYDEAALRGRIDHAPHKSSALATFGRGLQAMLRGFLSIFTKTQTVEDAHAMFVANRPRTAVDLPHADPKPISLDKQTFGKAAGLVGNVVVKPFASRDVFGDGPKLTDIKQNPDLQDCWFLSSVASTLVSKGPDYVKSLIDVPANGDHANVKLGGRTFKVPLADYTDRKGNVATSNSAPWVKLLEMAAQMYFIDDLGRGEGTESKMEFRTGSTGIYLLSQGGGTTVCRPRSNVNIVADAQAAIGKGKAVTLGHTGIAHGIAPGHMVSVAGFSPDGSRVHLLDPYGRMVVADAAMLKDYQVCIEK